MSAYYTRWKSKIPLMVGVKEHDQSSEQAMEDNGDDDCSVYGAFDEAEYKRPSVIT